MSALAFFIDDEMEAERQLEIIFTIRKRRYLRDISNPFNMDENLFKKNFRLPKYLFKRLLDEISPYMVNRQRRTALPNVVKLACFLRFVGQGSYQQSVGNDYSLGLSQPTVSVVLSEILDIINDHFCAKWISYNYSNEEQEEAKLYFYKKTGLPGIIGSIDGTHIKIIGPKKTKQHLFYNRKGFYSLNAMIVCNHKKIIKYISAQYPGSCHDSYVWNMSQLKEFLDEKFESGEMRNTLILGDAGYPLSPYLITPYRSARANSQQARFNHVHSKGRIIVEHTIGLLKNVFRCLLGARELAYKPSKATKIVNACTAVHNFMLLNGYEYDDEYEPYRNELDEPDELEESEENSAGEAVRNELLNLI